MPAHIRFFANLPSLTPHAHVRVPMDRCKVAQADGGKGGTVMAYIVMAYTAMAYIVMAYTAMAYIVMAYIVMAYTIMAYTVTTYTVMAYTVMA